MRLTTLLLIVSLFQIHANDSYGQKTKISLNHENVSIEKVLISIESLTEFKFLYSDIDIDYKKEVTVKAKNERVSSILKNLFLNSNITFEIMDKQIILFQNPEKIKEATPIDKINQPEEQQKEISGVVKDSGGNPIPGVNIIIEGTTIGAITDFDGNFTISASEGDVLVFSYMGMRTTTVIVGSSNEIVVELIDDASALEEVVVVGYGTQKRSDISGSVATVKIDDLIAQPTTDLQGMLKGKVAGLYVTVGSARPGGSSNVLLRGIRSLSGGNSPLYVVDGVPMSNINELNIDDVESISVLKDASSQAIYGARASNGVILITTKRGSNTGNKVNVSYNSFYSIQNVDPNFEIFGPEEYAQLRREAYRGDLATAENDWIGTYPDEEQMFTPLEMELLANKNYVNWTDYAFKKDVPLTKHDISMSGGNDKTMYSASLGYYEQDGIRMSSDLTRYSGRLTLDQMISKTFKTGLSVYYTTYNQNQETNPWLSFFTFSPISQIYDENGNLNEFPTGNGTSVNPLLYEETRNYEYIAERLIINGYLEVTPTFLPGLKYKLNASMNSRNRERNSFRNFDDSSARGMGYASINFSKNKDYIVENIFTYDKNIQSHKINLTLMQGFEKRYTFSTTSTANQLGNDFFGINSLGSALQAEVGRGLTERQMVSFMGRVNYSYMEKYLLNVTFRADGSSVFGANNKWGTFPSAALAWNLGKENFMKDVNWLNEAKIRLSYGQIGNQGIGPYGSLATANNAFYVSGDEPVVGYLPGSSLPNPNLRWETTTTLNTGLDFGLFDRRLTGSIEYYKSNTTDLLVNRKIPTVLGYSNIPGNLGEIQNSGFETSVTGFIVSTTDFNWSVTANFSKNKNKLLKGVLQDPVTGEFIDDVGNKWFIGQPINVYYDYQFDGIFQLDDDITNSAQPNARPGDVRVADVSGPDGTPDGLITSDDQVVIKRDPKWMGSLTSSVNYKGFDFSFNIYTVQGVIKNNAFLSDYNHGGRMDGKNNGVKRDYWTPVNPSNTAWRPHSDNQTNYQYSADLQDASYVRLRNITLDYNLPNSLLENIGLSKVKVYVTGDNLWTKTDYSSYSPEGNVDSYPETKNFTVGLNINF